MDGLLQIGLPALTLDCLRLHWTACVYIGLPAFILDCQLFTLDCVQASSETGEGVAEAFMRALEHKQQFDLGHADSFVARHCQEWFAPELALARTGTF